EGCPRIPFKRRHDEVNNAIQRHSLVKRALLAGLILLLLIAAAVLLLPSWASRSTPYVRQRILDALNARFASQVDVDVLNVDVYPQPEVSGKGLRLRYNGRTDIPPLI